MNTRSRTRAAAERAAPTMINTPASLGIEFGANFQLNCFNRLKNREIKSTKWACPFMLNQLGIHQDFDYLCNNVGLSHFVFQEAATYRRLTLEFLSTLMHTVGKFYCSEEECPGVDQISFRLMNREYDLTLDNWCHYFGFENSPTAIRASSFMINPSPTSYFNLIKAPDTLAHGNSIECPALRYLYYVIANTLQARHDFTRVNEEDMIVLAKAAFPNCNIIPNLGAILLMYLKHQALETQGPICGGGVITVLAQALQINVSNLQALEGPRRLSFATLNACGMVKKINGSYYFNIPGADHLIAAPLPNGIFSIENGRLHYDAQVEAELPHQR